MSCDHNKVLCCRAMKVLANDMKKVIQSNADSLIKSYTFTVTFGDLSPNVPITFVLNDTTYSTDIEEGAVVDDINTIASNATKISPQYSITTEIDQKDAQSLAIIGKDSHVLDLRYVIEGQSESFTLYPKTSYAKGFTFSTIERVQQITSASNHVYINLIDVNNANIAVYAMYENSCITKSTNIPNACMTGNKVTFTLRYI